MSSVSVGKPAMKSAPNTASGRAWRIASHRATASRRVCRRFMRLRIVSSPAWRLRWKCGISRGSSAIRPSRSSSTSTGSSEDRRSLGRSGTRSSRPPGRLTQGRGAGQVLAVVGDIDPGQHDFAESLGDQRPRLIRDRPQRYRPARAPAEGDDAERAAVIAALLHLEERAGAPFETADQMWRRLAHGHDVVDANPRRFAVP